jgi:hypothetical protein
MKKTLYLIYIPLLIIEWLADMLLSVIKVIHSSIEVLTLSVQKEINEPVAKAIGQPAPLESKPGKPVSGDIINGGRPASNDRRAVSRVRR